MKRFRNSKKDTNIFFFISKKILDNNLHAIWYLYFLSLIINHLFFFTKKKYIYSILRIALIEYTDNDKNYPSKFQLVLLKIFRMERVQNGCQSCNAFNKIIKSWRFPEGGRSRHRAAKIVQLKVYSVQASLTLRDLQEELSATRLPRYYFHLLLAIRELSVALNKTSDRFAPVNRP